MHLVVFTFVQSDNNSEYYFLISSRGKTGDRIIGKSSEQYKNLDDTVHAAGLIMAPMHVHRIVVKAGDGVPKDNLQKFVNREFPTAKFEDSQFE